MFGFVTRRDRTRWWLLLLGLLFLAAAMGRALPLRGWLYDWLPPMRYFRHSALFRCYYIVAVAMLALHGARELNEILKARAAGGVKRAAAWVPLVLVVLAIADAASTSWLLRPVLFGDAAATWRGLGAVHRKNLDLTAGGLGRVPENGANLTFVSKTPAMAGYEPLAGPLFTRYRDEPVLLASAVGRDRLWFSPTAVNIDRSEECFDAFRLRAIALGAPPLVIHSRLRMSESYEPRSGAEDPVPCPFRFDEVPAAQRLSSDAIAVTFYDPTALHLRVEVPQAGWLLVTDSWSRGWQATVNGVVAPLRGGNFIFRAVQVQQGSNEIEFTFTAFGFPWLVALSWGTLGVVAAVSARSSR